MVLVSLEEVEKRYLKCLVPGGSNPGKLEPGEMT